MFLQGKLPVNVECYVTEMYLIQQAVGDIAEGVLPEEMQQMLDNYQQLFEFPTELPPRNGCDHHIPFIPGATLVRSRPYRHSPELKTEIEKQIAEMLASGVIRPSTSAFSSPLIAVKKKDSTWRLCPNFRRLNALTLKSIYPLPVIDELLDELQGACWFSKLDLRAGYHQIRLAPGEEYKTAFTTHQGHFEFLVMAFGLTGAPATFQSVMNKTLAHVLRKCALVFFDDILVYCPSYEQHLQHVKQVLSLLSEQQWRLKPSKCSFAQQQINYLGHTIQQLEFPQILQKYKMLRIGRLQLTSRN
jgi:hypothetical protein